jgi:hypothetical protein
MKKHLFLLLLLAGVVLTSFESKPLPKKSFCGAGINIVNNTSSNTITAVAVTNADGTLKFKFLNIQPGQSYYLTTWPSPLNNFTVKLAFASDFTGGIGAEDNGTHLSCAYYDESPAGFIIGTSFSTNNCHTYDVSANDGACW